jgi:hypothetical protein
MTPRIDEMRDQIHATHMPSPQLAAPTPRRRVRMISGGMLALAAVIAVVLFLASSGSDAPPAYAAVLHTNGGQRTVTITLRQERDIPKLNARLQAEHTRIRVVPVVRGCHDPVRRVGRGKVLPGPPKTMLAIPEYLDGKPIYITSLTVEVDTIPGRTFVIPGSRTGLFSGGDGVIVGPAPTCLGIGPRANITS